MTVSLPMYQPPELSALTDAWWQALGRHFRAAGIGGAPDALTRPTDLHAHWRSPSLLFSQACGFPLTHAFAGCWQVVATPCYAAPGCEGPYYRSLLIVRADAPFRSIAELRGRTACFNSRDSQSGYNILRATIAPLARGGRFFGHVVQSGGHIHSAAMVQRGEADLAALDCVTHALYARHAPHRLEGTRVLCQTAAAPGLPYITAAATDAPTLRRLRDGLQAALADPALAGLRAELLIQGASLLPDATYSAITDVERQAMAAGYPDLG